LLISYGARFDGLSRDLVVLTVLRSFDESV